MYYYMYTYILADVTLSPVVICFPRTWYLSFPSKNVQNDNEVSNVSRCNTFFRDGVVQCDPLTLSLTVCTLSFIQLEGKK